MIALYGADAAVHDFHAGRAGDFAATIAAIAAGAAGATVTTMITRSNYRVLAALPPLLQAHRVGAWELTVARLGAQPERLVARLAMALPFALHAIDRATKLGIAATIVDAPRCLLGPFADRSRTEQRRSYPPICEACALRGDCAGVDDAYLARFGAGELTAR